LRQQQEQAAQEDQRQAPHHAVAHRHQVRLSAQRVSEGVEPFRHACILLCGTPLRQFDTLGAAR